MDRPTRWLALAVALAALAAPAAAGNGGVAAKCGFVALTPQSGDGVFDIRAQHITCAAARRKLRAARGDPRRLTGWRCRLVRRDETTGAGRYRCTSRARVHGALRTRVIAFTTGN